MNNSFPLLIDDQVVLSRADGNTGIVLDEEFIDVTKPSQVVYTIYPDLIAAVEAAKLIVLDRPHVECYIHNKNNTLLKFIDKNTSE